MTGPPRRALNARDQHCRWPGCDRPATWCTPHHVIHWARGGSTNLDNQLLLCSRHHRRVHEGGWQILVAEDGRVLTIPPPIPIDFYCRGPIRRSPELGTADPHRGPSLVERDQ